MIYQYNLNGEFLRQTTMGDLLKLNTKKSDSTKKMNITNALNGYKGYGYYEGFFISSSDVKIQKDDEKMIHFDKWCSINIDRIMKGLKRVHKEWSEDIFGKTVLDLCEAVVSDRGVNNPEEFINYKYGANLIDDKRMKNREMRTIKGEDFDFTDDNGEATHTYIDTQTESFFDDGRVEVCLEDVNNMKKYDVMFSVLCEYFDELTVKVYINYELKPKKTRKTYKASMQEFGLTKHVVRNKVRLVQGKIEEIIPIILERYNELKYPTFDEMTLKNIIND